MPSPPLTMTLVSSTQPNINGWVILLEAASNAVLVNYILYVGDNATSAYSGEFINGTATLGEGLELVSVSGSTYTYTLYVPTTGTLPTADYFFIASAVLSDSSVTPYPTTPLTLPFSPDPVTLIEDGTVISRNGYDDRIIITFPQNLPSGFVSTDFVYTAAVQYTTTNTSAWSFETVSELPYNTGVGGIIVPFPTVTLDPVDECYCAVQVVRVIDTNVTGISSSLSNTIYAVDQSTPSQPTNLAASYDYNAQTVGLTWLAGTASDLTDVTGFTIYRQIGTAAFTNIGTKSYTTGVSSYSYTDTLPSSTAGTVINYYVKANNAQGSSLPSNTASITYTIASSAPRLITGSGLRLSETTSSLEIDWTQPTTVTGTTGEFEISVYLGETATGTPYTYTVPLVVGPDRVYQLLIGNTVNPPIAWSAAYTVKIRLNTINPNPPGNIINGAYGQTLLFSGYAPLITDVNGVDNNTVYGKGTGTTGKLFQFTVYSSVSLKGVSIFVLEPSANIADNNTTYLRVIGAGQQYDPYSPHYNTFYQIYEVSAPIGQLPVNIYATNQFGPSYLAITGTYE